jgi:hypothetical protein
MNTRRPRPLAGHASAVYCDSSSLQLDLRRDPHPERQWGAGCVVPNGSGLPRRSVVQEVDLDQTP